MSVRDDTEVEFDVIYEILLGVEDKFVHLIESIYI